MNFIGKTIGFFLGYLVLGPLGAVIGLLIGAAFDRGLRLHLHEIPREHTEEVEQAFFTASFSVMGHLAKSDGSVSASEIRAAESVMAKLELNDTLRQEAIRLFQEGKSKTFNLQLSLDQLYKKCHRHPELLRFFIEIQLEAALADGPLQSPEQNLLLYMCERLKISPLEFEQLWARQWASQSFNQWYSPFENEEERGQYQRHQQGARSQYSYGYSGYGGYGHSQTEQQRESSSLRDAFGVLGVSENATPAEIKTAYRRLMNQHHPDKMASRGLPESMLKMAKEKTQAIRAAYDLVRQARGFR